jgi:hypothetical protein
LNKSDLKQRVEKQRQKKYKQIQTIETIWKKTIKEKTIAYLGTTEIKQSMN